MRFDKNTVDFSYGSPFNFICVPITKSTPSWNIVEYLLVRIESNLAEIKPTRFCSNKIDLFFFKKPLF